jgi:mRNA interferase MazF
MERGEVWWARLPPPIGTRPVLLLSRPEAYRVRASLTFALITTTVRGIPVEVRLGPEDGMPRDCVVNCDEVHTAPRGLLNGFQTRLAPIRMEEVARALRFALAVECDN